MVKVFRRVGARVRRDDGARVGEQRVLVRQGLGVGDVQAGAEEAVLCVQCGEDVLWEECQFVSLRTSRAAERKGRMDMDVPDFVRSPRPTLMKSASLGSASAWCQLVGYSVDTTPTH